MAEHAPDGCCVIDVGGVGYDVHVPARIVSQLGSVTGEAVLFVHTHVREDAFTLYGFDSVQDREVFRKLLSVSNVGPRLAMAILGVLNASELVHAITRGDRSRLKGVSGVGPKTIDRIVLELKDKLDTLVGQMPAPTRSASRSDQAVSDPLTQVAAALMQMGYKRSEATQAVAAVAADIHDKPVETLLREALAALA